MKEISSGKFKSKRINFTQVSNTALHDRNLSLKTKGLYSFIRSYITIPNYVLYKWYLEKECMEGERAFQSAWNELKVMGYLKQIRIRNKDKNKFEYEYDLLDEPDTTTPALINMRSDGSIIVYDTKDEQSQNDDVIYLPDNDENIIELPITEPLLINLNDSEENIVEIIENISDDFNVKQTIKNRREFEKSIKKNIEYEILLANEKNKKHSLISHNNLDEILNIMIDVVCSKSKTIRVSKEDIPHEVVKNRFLQLDSRHIEYVRDRLEKTTSEIKNIKSYLITTLYNSTLTINTYYKQLENYD